MRQKSLCLLALISMLLLPAFSVSADERVIHSEAVVVENFDSPGGTSFLDTGEPVIWKVLGSDFSVEGYPRQAYANAWPRDLMGQDPVEKESLGVLGVHAKFTRQGYNYLEIVPGLGTGEDWTPKSFMLPGRVQYIDYWVWGSKYDYTMELHLMDYRGINYVLEMGSINHAGWRNMNVEIPSYIRQSKEYIPYFEGLKLTKIVLRTSPTENVSGFYVYLDHIKVVTDLHESLFDGEELARKGKISEIWGSEEEATDENEQ